MKPSAFLLVVLFLLLPHCALGFVFTALSITATPPVINTISSYLITMNRGWYSGGPSAYSTPVPTGSTIVIQFPGDYSLPATGSYPCSAKIITDSTSSTCPGTCVGAGNSLTLSGCFTSPIAVLEVDLTITGITNPTPALLTGSFAGWIGTDYSSTQPGEATLQLSPGTFTSCSISFTPATVNRTASMIVTATPKNQIPASGSLVVVFPNQGYWTGNRIQQAFGISSSMSCSGTNGDVSASFSCSGDTANKLVTSASPFLVATINPFTIQIANILTPPIPSNSDQLTIISYSGTNQIDTCSVSVTGLQPNTVAVSITSSSTMLVNTPVPLSFSIVLSDTMVIPANTVTITFPTGTTFPGGAKISSMYGNPTGLVSLTGSTTVNFTLSVVKISSAGDTLTFLLNNYTIPTSTITQSISVSILSSGGGSSAIMSGTGTITGVSSVLTATVTPLSTIVSLNTSYTFVINLPDPLSSTGMISIVFPSQVSPSVPASCATVTGSGSNVSSSGNTCTQSGQTVTITGFGTGPIPSQTLTMTIAGITNAGTVAPTGTFLVTSYYSANTSSIVSTGTAPAITATPGTVTNAIVTPLNYQVKKSLVTYSISFQISHLIPTGGSIVLGIPPAIGGPTPINSINTQCLGSVGTTPTTTTCVASQNSSGIFVSFTSLFSASPASSGATITLQIASSLTNPSSTKTVSSFSISTLGPLNFLIDQLSTGISVVMTDPAPFNSVSASLASGINSATTAYTFTINQPSDLEAGSFLSITFPATIIPQSSVTCTDGLSNILTCTPTTAQTIKLTLTAQTAGTNFVVILNNIKNAPSLKPSAAFTFATVASDGSSQYSRDSTTVTVVNTASSTFVSISGTFAGVIYGQTTNLSIQYTPVYSGIGSTVITLASDFTIGALACSSITGTTGTCAPSSNTVTLTGPYLPSSVGLTIGGLTAPTGVSSKFTKVLTYDADNYLIDSSNSSIQFVASCNLPCMQCVSGSPSNCTSCYNNPAVTSASYFISDQATCVQTCPSNYFATGMTCIICNPICLTCVGSSTNCTSCNPTSTSPYFYNFSSVQSCYSTCPTYYYGDALSKTCQPCVAPCLACLSATACLTCQTSLLYYSGNNTCVNTCPIDISINTTTTCDPCSILCQTCSKTTNNCTSCAAGTVFYGGNCLAKCPAGKVDVGGTCGGCAAPCDTCDTLATNCTSCVSGGTPFLYVNSCVAVCPVKYYTPSGSGPGVCISCVSLANLNCDYCVYNSSTSAAVCSSTCNLNYVYFADNQTCLASVPFGYVNISNIAQKCAAQCQECLGSQSNCSSCSGTTNLYVGNCISTCPLATIAISNICQPCATLCASCSGSTTNCNTCIVTTPKVYLNNGNQCTQVCPASTYANDVTLTCATCQNNCATCTSATTCTSCSGSNNLYNGNCLATCPQATVPINNQCQSCTANCATCSGTTSNCTSCAVTFPSVYLSANQCIQTCPSTTYADDSTLTCSACINNCATCTSKNYCLTCNAGTNLYANTCQTACPAGYVGISSVCTACATNCSSCVGLPTNCTSCSMTTPPVYFSFNQCVTNCPNTAFPDNGSLTCLPCSNNCATCTSLTSCLSCSSGFYLYSNTCKSQCPSGFVGLGSSCSPCTNNCSQCVGTTSNCTSCAVTTPSVYLNANQCTPTCPSTSYPSDSSLTCVPCQNNCATCTSKTSCLSCNSGTYLYGNTCQSTCPAGFVGLAGQCSACHSNCTSCVGSTTNCLSCAQNYYYVQSSSSCLLTCPTNLYPYSQNMSCIACLSPCQTCSGIPTNCTSCLTGGLLGNQCYSPCPDSYYLNNGVCLGCQQGCATCTSSSVCTSCLNGFHYYQSSCLTECPASAPVVASNGSCVGCSTQFCSKCSSQDSCYLCQGTKLVYSSQCVDTCPQSFQSNGTFCLQTKEARSLSDSLKDNGVIPMPFSIAAFAIILVCLFSKFAHETTFFTGAVYGLVGLLEPVVHAYYIFLLYTKTHTFNLMVLLTIGALACLYFVNLLSLVLVNISFCRDQKFKAWYATRSGRCSYITFCILTVVFSFKSMNLIFSKLFDISIFSAKLQHRSRMFCLHLMSFLAISHSAWAIVMACFNLYYSTDIATMLFFQSVDLIVICLLELILGIANARKEEDFFDDKWEHAAIGKKISIEGDSQDTLMDGNGPRQEQLERGSAAKYEIQKRRFENAQEVSGFMEEVQAGTNMMPNRDKYRTNKGKKRTTNSYEQLSERSQAPSIGDPSSRSIVDPLMKPNMNFREMSRQFHMNSESMGDQVLNTDGDQQNERVGTLESFAKSKKKNDVLDDHDSFGEDDFNSGIITNGKRGVPQKLKKTHSTMNKIGRGPIKQTSGEQNNSNQLMDSNDQSQEHGGIEKSPFDGNNPPKIRTAQSLTSIQPRGSRSPSIRKRTLQQDVQELQWDDDNNNGDAISPKKKPTSKLELGNDDIGNISGISDEGRQNVLKLKSQMENRQIDQASNEEDNDQKGNEGEASSPDGPKRRRKSFQIEHGTELDKSRQMDKAQLQMLQNMGSGGFKKKKVQEARNTIFSNQKDLEYNNLQESEGRLRGSAFLKNSQTMDKSILESDDDIIHHPAYVKYKKAFEENSKNYLSARNRGSMDQTNINPGGDQFDDDNLTFNRVSQVEKQGETMPLEKGEMMGSEDFPDELSKQLRKHTSKEDKTKKEENWILGNNGRDRFAFSAGNRSVPFLRPIQLSRGTPLQNQYPMSIEENGMGQTHQHSSLQRIPEGPSRNLSPDTSLLRRPKYTSARKPPRQKEKKVHNKELQRIYLGSTFNK